MPERPDAGDAAARLRLFVALELPPSAQAELARWAAGSVGALSELRLLRAEDLHATLCFLGSLPAGAAGEIVAALGPVAALPAAPLALGEPLWLPRRGPRVLAVALADREGALARTQSALAAILAERGWYRPEARPFLPHVTVARVRHGARIRAGDLAPPAAMGFPGARVTLYRSRLGRGGARYEAVGGVELSG
ncbi:MAG TPA: RNA 2',3'-cyclic phosphodiesterase [Solirubrobacteraceae bacterium]|nr:RNA 2',3'-cyclic phosphodiesterase [Solirubrobacteraceae bacterium]